MATTDDPCLGKPVSISSELSPTIRQEGQTAQPRPLAAHALSTFNFWLLTFNGVEGLTGYLKRSEEIFRLFRHGRRITHLPAIAAPAQAGRLLSLHPEQRRTVTRRLLAPSEGPQPAVAPCAKAGIRRGGSQQGCPPQRTLSTVAPSAKAGSTSFTSVGAQLAAPSAGTSQPSAAATPKAGHQPVVAPSAKAGPTRRSGLRVGGLLLLFLLCQLTTVNCKLLLHAQTTNASLTGQVTDTSGAAVPNAKVVAVNDATNVKYETKTNNDGIYVEPNLPPGTYHVEVTKEGFKNVIQPGIELHVQDGRSANYTLQVGAQSETVTVQESSYMINTQDASVSTTVDRNFAENLPLNGRSFQTLILLTPGTVLGQTGGNYGTFSVNGQRANANTFTLDGVSANLGGFQNQSSPGDLNGANPSFTIAGTTQGMVSVDALQEFKIQTSTYAPEFGRQPGGQVSLLTRSGTNAFHGTAFDYFRNTALDANNWFNNATIDPNTGKSIPRGVEHQNDFGGTLGGPIVKDRTFFFFSYEGLRLLQPVAFIDTVPSIRLRSEATPAYQAVLNSWPIPDGPEFTSPDPVTGQPVPTGGAPYTDSQSFPTKLDSYSIKADHTLKQHVHLFGRYTNTTSSVVQSNGSNGTIHEELRSRGVTLGGDTDIGPNLNNELRLNYSTNTSEISYGPNLIGSAKAFDASVYFPSPLVLGRNYGGLIISFPNGIFFSSVQGPSGKFSQRQINLIDNVSYSLKSHQLRWGVDYRRLFPIYSQTPLIANYIVQSENNLIAGTVSNTSTSAVQTAHPIYMNLSIYGQDTWKVSSYWMITYGLRWELNPAPGERDGIQPLNALGLDNLATATLAPLNSKLYKTTYNNFGPRIGVTDQIRRAPGHETVLRGGFGVFYDLNSETTAIGFSQAPFQNSSPVLTTLPNSTAPIPFPVPSGVLPIATVPATLKPPYRNIYAIDPNLSLPYTLQWNVSVEQGLGQNQSLTTSYVASSAHRLLRSTEAFDINSNFPNIFILRNASSSNYQALQLQFNRNFSHGLQALLSYSYSHSIDNASDGQNVFTSNTGNTIPNPNIDRGNSSFDLRHAFRGAFNYNIPTWNTNLVSKAALGGWSIDAVGVAQTGLPVELIGNYYFPQALPDAFFSLRPNVIPGQPLYLYGSQCAAAHGGIACPGGRAFNPAAFTPVPTDANGNPTQIEGTLGRNVMRGFGAWQVDFALHRQFNLTERANLQFRAEFFNLFNHPNFSSISTFCCSGLFGEATATLNNSLGGLNSLYQIGGPRSVQLALKLSY